MFKNRIYAFNIALCRPFFKHIRPRLLLFIEKTIKHFVETDIFVLPDIRLTKCRFSQQGNAYQRISPLHFITLKRSHYRLSLQFFVDISANFSKSCAVKCIPPYQASSSCTITFACKCTKTRTLRRMSAQ